jgi:hypothetical protein
MGRGSVPRPGRLYPRERPGTHCTRGWVGPRAGLDGRKISSPPGFDPGPSSPQSVTTQAELPGAHIVTKNVQYNIGNKIKETEIKKKNIFRFKN